MDELIQQARLYARQGHSKHFAAQLLGMGHKRFARLINGHEIDWPKPCESIGWLQARRETGKLLRTRAAHPNSIAALTANRIAQGKVYEAFGESGRLSELCQRFNCPVSVKVARERVRKGWDVERAITTPKMKAPRGVYPPQFVDWLIKRRRLAAAELIKIAEKRITPSMLVYRDDVHEIITTARHGHVETVDIRLNGKVLHRLRFPREFASGVLFVYRPEINKALQLIAFEPDCAYLVQENDGLGPR